MKMISTTSLTIFLCGHLVILAFFVNSLTSLPVESSSSSVAAFQHSLQHQKQQQQTFQSYFSSVKSTNNNNNRGCNFVGEGESGGGGGRLECTVRTLSNSSVNLNPGELVASIEKVTSLRLTCNDKLFYESFLTPYSTFTQFEKVETIEIKGCKIRKIPKRNWLDKFGGSLKTLKIVTRNGEWPGAASALEIETGAFSSLKLKNIDLSENNIFDSSSLQSLVFCQTLKLNLSINRISELKEFISEDENDNSTTSSTSSSKDNGCSSTLSPLQSLDLSYNAIQRIKNPGFTRFPKLLELRLDNNLLHELDNGIFSPLTSLKLLNLQNNSITNISPNFFSNLKNLLLLDLSKNHIEKVKDTLFTHLTHLRVLKLSYNQLSYIEGKLFEGNSALTTLHLDNNRIETIHPSAFSSLLKLTFLDLSKNRLTVIENKLLSLPNLKQLYLDHNKIRRLEEESLKNCTNLEDLGLAGNLLHSVPNALKYLKQLRTLDIGENRLTNASFTGLSQPGLYGLRLVGNRINEIPSGFCEPLMKIRVLNMAQNHITRISPSFSCPELRALRLDTNGLESLPVTFSNNLPSLLWLNVSGNRLREINPSTSLPRKLEWLDLSYNKLEHFAIAPSHAMFLRIIDISHNVLSQFSFLQSIPPFLETLRLNHNQIKVLNIPTMDLVLESNSRNKSERVRLRRVELFGNQLETLPTTLSNLPGKPEFLLGNNPLKCDCHLEHWLTQVNYGQLLIVDLESVYCTETLGSPPQRVLLTEANNFLCPYESHCGHECLCCDFLACDCHLNCPEGCTCYHDNAWMINVVQCSVQGLDKLPMSIPMEASELYLDGNSLNDLKSHSFIGRKNLQSLYLNSSRIETIKNKTFNGLSNLQVLHLENNLISQLHGHEFSDTPNIRELYLQNNLLRFIEAGTFSQMRYLNTLYLDGNLLVDYPIWIELSVTSLNYITLSGNPWSCECSFIIQFLKWISSKTSSPTPGRFVVGDLGTVNRCANFETLCANQEDNRIALVLTGEKPSSSAAASSHNEISLVQDYPASGSADEEKLETSSAVFWALTLSLSLSGIALVALLTIVFRREVFHLSQSKCGKLFWAKFGDHHQNNHRSHHHNTSTISRMAEKNIGEEDKLYDAYFIYSKLDEDVLVQKIAPVLEFGLHYRLCLHWRDLCIHPDNPFNEEMVHGAVGASRRVFIVLSKNFQTEIVSPQLQSLFQSVINREKVNFIILPPLSDQSVVSGKFKNSSQILDWSDEGFWTKLKTLLPPVGSRQGPYSTLGRSTLTRTLHHHQHHHPSHLTITDYPYSFHRNNIVAPLEANPPPPTVVPKHHILLTNPIHNAAHNHTQFITLPHQTIHHQHPQHPIRFGDSFKRYQMKNKLINNSFSSSVGAHSHPDTSKTAYRPLQPNYSSSQSSNVTSTSDSSGGELEHIYSTLDCDSNQNGSHLTLNHDQICLDQNMQMQMQPKSNGESGEGESNGGSNNNGKMYFV